MSANRKVTTSSLLRKKQRGEKITLLTAYDFPIARFINQAGVDIILVSDAVGTVGNGRPEAVSVSVEEMIYHTQVVRNGAGSSMVVTTLPFGSYETNEQISRDTPLLVNVVDTPNLCNFIVPSVIQRGSLTIAVSTSGISPALSKSIRKELERIYTSAFSSYMKSLRKVRADAKRSLTCKEKREGLLKAVASEKVLEMLRRKGLKETKKVVNTLRRYGYKNTAIIDEGILVWTQMGYPVSHGN